MDKPHRWHSLTTWRYFGRAAFHARPDHRCLPSANDPEALDAWCHGFRLAWRAWYASLPSTEFDTLLLEFALTHVLHSRSTAGITGDPSPTHEPPAQHLR